MHDDDHDDGEEDEEEIAHQKAGEYLSLSNSLFLFSPLQKKTSEAESQVYDDDVDDGAHGGMSDLTPTKKAWRRRRENGRERKNDREKGDTRND